jgi:hypothetical protein
VLLTPGSWLLIDCPPLRSPTAATARYAASRFYARTSTARMSRARGAHTHTHTHTLSKPRAPWSTHSQHPLLQPRLARTASARRWPNTRRRYRRGALLRFLKRCDVVVIHAEVEYMAPHIACTVQNDLLRIYRDDCMRRLALLTLQCWWCRCTSAESGKRHVSISIDELLHSPASNTTWCMPLESIRWAPSWSWP